MSSETIPGGYNGKILRVNLSNNSISTEEIQGPFCRKYLGGAGFVAYFLLKELQAGVDPLGPDNKLVFATGPLTGIKLSGSARHCVGAKSPLTNTIAKAEAGEFWGVELKYAGFDALIVEGKADKPVYISINDGQAAINDAAHLWGKNTKETQEIIRAELKDGRVRVALIGPGGENLVKYACIMHGLFDAAGRGGLGAVMGSKNLKAIAVRGHHPPPIASPERVKEYREWLTTNIEKVRLFQELGSGAYMVPYESSGNLPVRNFRDGLFPNAAAIEGKTIKDTIRVGMDGCFGCIVRCKKVVKIDAPYRVDPAYGGPEYETLAGLGSNCGIDNLKAICKGNELCNAYSLDTISTGLNISFAMECFEKGILTSKDTGGLEIRFGDAEIMLKLIELIAFRKGIGDLLADGTAIAAQKIGRGAGEYAMQVKGLELALHEPRLKAGLGLGYMVNPNGADHCMNIHDTSFAKDPQMKDLHALGILEGLPPEEMSPKKVTLFKAMQFLRLLGDCLPACMILPYNYKQLADLTSAVTGWDMEIPELTRIAGRILTMMRLFNIREGFNAADDKLPARFFEPKTDGYLSQAKPDPAKFERAKRYYYALMGWDAQTGIPTPETLEDLGLPVV
ncbi:MAG: aldehyde ferredoxin oxidoreductase family protein [Dehalococcoidales bacterium]